MIRLALRLREDDAGIVLAQLLELVPAGVEERTLPGGALEYAIYGAPVELPKLPPLRALAGDRFVEITTDEVADDWTERWREFHRPAEVAAADRRLRIRPPWEPAVHDVAELVIDPGRAFGTGGHATTRLCLELLLAREPGGALADWGCGSGVIAIAAAKLGYTPVIACDNDPAAVAVARENADINGVSNLDLRRVDLRTEPGPMAPVVLANLIGPLLLELAYKLTVVPDVLIVSGLLVGESDAVASVYARHGLVDAKRRAQGDWAALELVKR